ncbi:MAG: glycosyl hydrolase [bacterium]|nr:glycosyl hydrolase [bacterium]
MKRIIFLLIVLIFTCHLLLPVQGSRKGKSSFNSAVFNGLRFRAIGPALMSGRISDIAIHPRHRNTWYVAAGSGGIWKTVNAGATWQPIFDQQSSYSIGCVSIDPGNPDVIWAGTGENSSGRHVGFGDGIYKSLNGGKTWQNMGLKMSEHISKIVIDPRNSQVIFAAAEGPLWSPGGQRGLYKSSDGGNSWSPALDISRNTGVTDVAFEPGNPDTIYAATYQRRRIVASFLAGGPESGIHKSTDGGKSWRKLTVGLPKGHLGRIGLAVSPIKTNVVYATIEAKESAKGFYRSMDRGESWEKRSSFISGGTGPHYYQEIFADPHRFDRVYQMDIWLRVSDNGGKSFHRVNEKYKHSDNHALAFDPTDPDFLLVGTDGGLYETRDMGNRWRFFANLPLTQFYKMALDNSLPFYNIHGGTQDNGSQMGPSRTLNTQGIRNCDWFITSGADGYGCAIDPVNPDIIYTQWQNGSLLRYDKKSGEMTFIKPQAAKGEVMRCNWDSPIVISPHSPTRLYFASQRLYRSDNRGDSWTAVSPDLSRGLLAYKQKIMEKHWSIDSLWDNDAMSYYSTVTRIAESPLKEGLIYAGTDDGLLNVTGDGGKTWQKIEKLPGVPDFFFVNDIAASLHDADTVFAALDNHKTGDFKPYLVKSTDRGKSWTSITGNLPQRTIIWAIAQDHKKADLLFAGTEFGIYFTNDCGNHWQKLSSGLPTIAFRDIEIQQRENDLVCASFGRGFFVLDDFSPLRFLDNSAREKESLLFPVKKAVMYIPKEVLGFKEKGFMGNEFYTASNPHFGAIFTYYLKDSLKTAKTLRLEREKALEKQGKSVTIPGWDELHREEREEKPAVILTVTDRNGNVVRRLSGPVSAGLHRVAWDLRYPPVSPTSLTPFSSPAPWVKPPIGPLVVPGTFKVSLSKQVAGVLSSLGESQSFVVESLGLATLPETDRAALLAFQEKAGDLQRKMSGISSIVMDYANRLKYIKKALMDTPKAGPQLKTDALKLEQRLLDIQDEIYGDNTIASRSEPIAMPLMWRVYPQLSTTSPVTASQKLNYEIAAADFKVVLKKLRQLIEVDIKSLEERMEAAGAPWTPGRSLPKF